MNKKLKDLEKVERREKTFSTFAQKIPAKLEELLEKEMDNLLAKTSDKEDNG
jgi:hypothetical protein